VATNSTRRDNRAYRASPDREGDHELIPHEVNVIQRAILAARVAVPAAQQGVLDAAVSVTAAAPSHCHEGNAEVLQCL